MREPAVGAICGPGMNTFPRQNIMSRRSLGDERARADGKMLAIPLPRQRSPDVTAPGRSVEMNGEDARSTAVEFRRSATS